MPSEWALLTLPLTPCKQQIRVLNIPFTEDEREQYRIRVFYNLVDGMRSLLEAMRELPPLEEASTYSFAAPVSSYSARPSNGVNPEGVVKRPRPAFLVHPPAAVEDHLILEPLESPAPGPGPASGEGGGEGKVEEEEGGLVERRESDGVSTLNTKPNRSYDTRLNNSPPTTPASLLPLSSFMENNASSSSLLHAASSAGSNSDPTSKNFTTYSPEPLEAETDADTSNPNANPNIDPENSNPNPCIDQPSLENPSRSPTCSPSLSLNIFHRGALTQRQHTALVNELLYVPDIRPGEPFPMEYEVLLRGLWWGWEGHMDGGGNIGNSGGGGIVREPGVGQYLDTIQSETGIALPDNLPYFFASPQRLSEWFRDDYVPSDEDILRCHGRTIGIQETVFALGKTGLGKAIKERRKHGLLGGVHDGGSAYDETRTGAGTTASVSESSAGHSHEQGLTLGPHPPQLNAPLPFPMGRMRLHFVDVGGRRSERRKWMHCFQDVTAVLFLVGLSGYSQGLVEDPNTNQMRDAMGLWGEVCSSPYLKRTPLILFLNKNDLFAKKMHRFPVKNYFPDYEGGDADVVAGSDYFKQKFLQVCSANTPQQTKPDPSTNTAPKEQERGKKREREKELEKGKGEEKKKEPEMEKGRERENEKGRGKGKGKVHISLTQQRVVYTHFTTATDTKQLQRAIVAICDIVLRDNLAAAHIF